MTAVSEVQEVLDHIESLDGRELDDWAAARIAVWWYDANRSGPAGRAFVLTGAISNTIDIWRDLAAESYSRATAYERTMLDYLGTYLVDAGPRGPVAGWPPQRAEAA